MKPWIQTYTGRAFPLLDPTPDDIDIVDIAHALSNLCRFAGHTNSFYSVAQHSALVSRHVPPHLALQALLHDAPEAYLVDIPRPLKHSGCMDGYAVVEERVWNAVADRFDVPCVIDPAVKLADNRALFTERRDLMKHSDTPWQDVCAPFPEPIRPWDPIEARRIFKNWFFELSRRQGVLN